MSEIKIPKWEMPKDMKNQLDSMQGWVSPINTFVTDLVIQQECDIMKAIQNFGVDIDKEELIKAIKYDREQYSKGYTNGYEKGRADERSKVILMLEDYSDKLNTLDFSEWRVKGMICDIIEQLKRG